MWPQPPPAPCSWDVAWVTGDPRSPENKPLPTALPVDEEGISSDLRGVFFLRTAASCPAQF